MGASRTIESVWILPPIAFARFGSAPTPMDNFHWASNDYDPRGTGETVVVPTWTFDVADDGTLSCRLPEELVFRHGEHWRPVCPFFEVHARWSDGQELPLTIDQLDEIGCSLGDVRWTVEAGNRKAYHYTLNRADLVEARLDLAGDGHERTPLAGTSPAGSTNPIVPQGQSVPFGHAQVIRPTSDFPVLRLRITPPEGRIYAPTDVAERDLTALLPADLGKQAFLAGIHPILNGDSDWAAWKPTGDDARTNPGGLYAQTPEGVSLGFLDDSNDGCITFELGGGSIGGTLRASARFTCCPPDFQPDRRPFVSVADGLADEQLREEVFEPAFVEGDAWPETEAEIADLMQRVRETMEASNLDHQNLRSALANQQHPGAPLDLPFAPREPRPGHPLVLLEEGRDHHKRFLAYEAFKRRMVDQPQLLDTKIRNPTDEPKAYDDLMPALMRGSDSNPMTLTQRQYQLLRAWLDHLGQP